MNVFGWYTEDVQLCREEHDRCGGEFLAQFPDDEIELERDDVTQDEMREVGEFLVYDENGNRHKLSDLSSEFKTVFVFIRVSHIFVLQAIIYCILDLYLQLHFRACCVLQRLNMLKVNFIVTGKSEYEY